GRDSNRRYLIRFWRDDLWRYDGQKYVKWPSSDTRARMFSFLENYFADKREGGKIPKAGIHLVNNVLYALSAIVHIESRVDAPVWIGADPSRKDKQYFAFTNGLLDVDELLKAPAGQAVRVYQHTPDWFSTICFEYT